MTKANNIKPKNIKTTDTWNFQDDINYTLDIKPRINEKLVKLISKTNNEPNWMLELRLKALKIFKKKSMPNW